MRTTKLTSTLTTVAYVHSTVNRNWVSPKKYHRVLPNHYENALPCINFGQIGHQTVPPKKMFWRTWAFTFTERLFACVQGPWNMIPKACGLACGWAYGCTIALVAAIIMVKAKQHSNPIVLDTVETTPTATSFCAISIQAFLPRLCLRRSGIWSHLHLIAIFCLQSVSAKPNADMFDNLGFSTLLLGRLPHQVAQRVFQQQILRTGQNTIAWRNIL